MNRIVALTLALLACCMNINAQELRAELAVSRFDSPSESPYVEVYLRLKGNSLMLRSSTDGFFSEVMISYVVTKNGKAIFEDAYKVRGPLVQNKETPVDFIDQQRIPLKMGKHELVMTIKDVHDPDGKEARIEQEVIIQQKLLGVFLSDIQLVDSYTKTTEVNVLSKAGYDLVPYTSNYYPETKKELSFYAEVYNTNRKIGEDGEFLINTFIENADDGKIIGNLRSFFKRKGAVVVPVLHTFPLTEVESGNYNLVVEARDKKNELLDRSTMFFQRSNAALDKNYALEEVTSEASSSEEEINRSFVSKYNRPEELEEYLRCLHPISTQEEITHVNRKMNFNDPIMMRQFMYDFWKKRNPDNPEEAWLAYWKEVQKVNQSYSNNLHKGYDTDRGRVYLQYGPPNTISPNYFEPNTYPYEIWHYYTLQDHINAPQNNRKFIFGNIDMGREFELIHSDAKNEMTNERWHFDINKRNNFDNKLNLDQDNTGDNYGGRARDMFENPY